MDSIRHNSSTSQKIIIKQQIPIKKLNLAENAIVNIVNYTLSDSLPFDYQFIQQSNKEAYLLASTDNPISLILKVNYKFGLATVTQMIYIEIKKSDFDYKFRLNMVFKNTSITDFLDHRLLFDRTQSKDVDLLYYFYLLRNPNVTIVSIKQSANKSLSVIVGNEFEFTSEIYKFIQSNCSAQVSNSTWMEMFDKIVGLKLEECSMMANASIIQPNSASHINITRDLFVKLEIDGQTSNASDGQISSADDGCTIKLLIFLLAIVCSTLNHYLHQA